MVRCVSSRSWVAFVAVVLASGGALLADGSSFRPDPEMTGAIVWGLELPVNDLERALEVYRQGLGFVVEEVGSGQTWAVLLNGETRLVLVESVGEPCPAGTGPTLNILVGSLPTAADAVTAAGGRILSQEPATSAVGPYLEAVDADGNSVHLIAAAWDDVEAGDVPRVFNIGRSSCDLREIEGFYTRLGFEVSSREYLPETLPLRQSGGSSLVFHHQENLNPRRSVTCASPSAIILETRDLRPVLTKLQAADVPVERSTAFVGRETRLQLSDPCGTTLRLAQRHVPWRPSRDWRSEGTPLRSPLPAARAFERLRSLEGTWRASSTKGWEAQVTFQVGGRGSFVAETTRYAENEMSTMITVYHMDGDLLMLTHYCEAGNQPRLVAADVGDHGRTITFTFLDATNLPSRADGHMDSAVLTLISTDRFSSRWSWYAGDRESWLEEIEYHRVTPGETAGGENGQDS